MIRFIFKRLLAVIPILFVLSFLTLFLINLTPGNYFDKLRLNPQVSQEIIQQYEDKFHINDNIFVQYFYWLKGVVQFDFGYSFAYHQPVTKIITMRLWNTFLLSFLSFLISWLIAIPLGVFAALRKDRFWDKLLTSISYALISFPGFLFAIILIYYFAHYTTLPVGGMRSIDYETLSWFGQIVDIGRHILLPLIVLTIFSTAYLFRIMRSNMLEVLGKDFVRVLRTRGLPDKVVNKHIIRNAVNPLITLFGMELPGLFSGAALIEIITGWPGLGQIMLQAVRTQDIFLVMGNMIMIAFLLMVGNMISDILLAINDPRVRMK